VPAEEVTFAVKVVTVPTVGERLEEDKVVLVAWALTVTVIGAETLAVKIAATYGMLYPVKPVSLNPWNFVRL
jgi:hypothetical protein